METTIESTGTTASADENAKNASRQAAEKLHQTATALRDRGNGGRNVMNRLAGNAAGKIDDIATYVEDFSSTRLKNDISNAIRNYPIQSVMIGMGIGFLTSRTLKRKQR